MSSGVGIRVEGTKAGWVVSELVRKGPAALSGKVRVGDLLVSVDRTMLMGASSALSPLMIGLPGSEVTLGIVRNPGAPVRYITLKRSGPVPPEVQKRSVSSLGVSSSEQQSSSLADVWVEDSFDQGALSPGSSPGRRSPGRPGREPSTGGPSRPPGSPPQQGQAQHNVQHLLEPTPVQRVGTASSVEEGVRPSYSYDLRPHSSSHLDGVYEDDDVSFSRGNRQRMVALLPGTSRHRHGASHPESTQPWVLDTASPAQRRVPASPPGQNRGGSMSPGAAAAERERERVREKKMIEKLKANEETTIGVGLGKTSGAEAEEAERKRMMAMIMRQPEGKMWKAEMKREREKQELELKARLAGDPATSDVTGGRFNVSNGKSEIEWSIYKAKSLPAPNEYNPKKQNKRGGGKFSESRRELSLVPRGQRDIPGPCSYAPDPLVLKPSRVVSMGNSDRKTNVDTLIYYAKQLPGPGEYDVKGTIRPPKEAHRAPGKPRAAHDTRLPDSAAVPGPGSYDTRGLRHRGGLATVSGGVIAETDVPSFIDLELARAKELPGPTDYVDNGKLLHTQGGRFSNSFVPSNVDVMCREAAKLPGPGHYRARIKRKTGFAKSTSEGSAISDIARRASKVPGPGAYGDLGPSIANTQFKGGKMSEARPKSDVEVLVRMSRELPGPGEYGAPRHISKESGVGTRIGPPPPRSRSVEPSGGGEGGLKPSYLSNVPDPMGLPGNKVGWKKQEDYYPFMRYRAR